MKAKQFVITFIISLSLTFGLISITNYSSLYKQDRHIEIAIQNCASGKPVEIIDFLYEGASIPLDFIKADEYWTREKTKLYSDGIAEAYAYISLTGQGACDLVFTAGSNTGTVNLYIDGQLNDTILLDTQEATAYTWSYFIMPITYYRPLIILFTLMFLLLFGFLLLIVRQYKYWNNNPQLLNDEKKSYLRVWWLNAFTALLYIAAAISRRINNTFFHNNIDYLQISFLFLLAIFLINFLFWKANLLLSQHISQKAKKIISISAALIFPVLSFLYLEWILDYSISSLNFPSILINIMWYFLVFGIFYILFSDIRSGICFGTTFFFILGLANYFVYSFRERPIIPSDLYVIQLAFDVSKNFSFQISDHIYLCILFLGLIWSLTLVIPSKNIISSPKKRFKKGAIWIGISVIVIISYFNLDYASFMNMSISWWDAEQSYIEHGFVASFMAYAQAMKIDRPEGYSVQKAEQLLSAYTDSEHKEETLPNVIVIMNEAWADFTNLSDLKTDIDYLPFYHGLTENTVKGNMYVSVWGGNTSNTEYEFLTGNSMSFFPYGSIPYQQYVTHMTENFTTLLKNKGYFTAAIHPYNSNGYNRSRVYPFFGFDETYFIEDFENPSYVRWCIDDFSSFRKIEEIYENNSEDGPQFIFNVTMQNHGGYGIYTQNGQFDPTIHVLNATSENADLSDIEEYLSLIQLTDEALSELISYFSNVKEETVIIMFGDHQPGILNQAIDIPSTSTDSGDMNELQKPYIVPFLIWANFDIKEQQGIEISSNYLNSYLTEILNLELSPYQRFLVEQHKNIPVMNIFGYKGSDENWYSYGTGPEEYESYLQSYQYLQYYTIFDFKTDQIK